MYDLIALGGGPAGYLAAERAAAAGLKTALFEKRGLGGVCLNEGCIPSKAMLHSANIYKAALNGEKYGVTITGAALDHAKVIARKNKVVRALVGGVKAKLKAEGVDVISEDAVIAGRAGGGYTLKAADKEYACKKLLIATGSSPILPPIPGLAEALESGFALTNREALELETVPEAFVIVGGGAIGLEMAAYYSAAGSRVTIVELLGHIGGPIDREISEALKKEYEKQGIKFLLETKVTGFKEGLVICESAGQAFELSADKALLSIGRKANVNGIGLETIGVETGRAGIIIDDRCRTNAEGVYAAGDVTGRHMLAHTAYREAEVAVNNMLGRRDIMRYHANPAVIYSKPEAACVGLTEEAAKAAGIPYEARTLPARYSGRYVAENEGGEGFIKALIHKAHRNVIGIHMLGTYSSEMIWGAAAMIEMEARVRDMREIIFPHPTVSELMREIMWTFE
jgi:dihydrolipoamide dehydrogenase